MSLQTDIAIVGGGASGVLLALQLLRLAPAGCRVALIERNPDVGPGIAYATRCPAHLLNTRAGDMSAWPDEPGHFSAWLGANSDCAGRDFVPRQVYGRYLRDMLADAVRDAGERLRLINAEVEAIAPDDSGVLIALGGSPPLRARRAVLATGHRPPSAELGAYRGDPWRADLLDGLDADASLLLIGTGLTMIDVIASLQERGHSGPIVAVSRRGLLPRRHAGAHGSATGDSEPFFGGELSARLARFRAMVRDGLAWESLMQALRPRNAALWQSLDEHQRQRFLRHLRPWWDVHRHRVPPDMAELVDALTGAGQLSLIAGRILALENIATRPRVRLARRGSGRQEIVDFDRVIDCRGPRSDIDADAPLLMQLAKEGLVRADPLALGLDVDEDDAVLAADGTASDRLFALGPPTRGRHWEITAIPDIRKRSAALAKRLVRSLSPEAN